MRTQYACMAVKGKIINNYLDVSEGIVSREGIHKALHRINLFRSDILILSVKGSLILVRLLRSTGLSSQKVLKRYQVVVLWKFHFAQYVLNVIYLDTNALWVVAKFSESRPCRAYALNLPQVISIDTQTTTSDTY